MFLRIYSGLALLMVGHYFGFMAAVCAALGVVVGYAIGAERYRAE